MSQNPNHLIIECMKFIADEMLGKLARWLRMGGLDVLYQNQIEDEDLLNIANEDGRIILTRDTKLITRIEKDKYLLIVFNYLHDQAKQFYEFYPSLLDEQEPLSRCAECNTSLITVPKEQVKDRVWPYVYKTHENFTQCPQCDRIYWEGTHVGKIKDRLELLKPDAKTKNF